MLIRRIAFVALVATAALAAQERIVAVGDVHGDYSQFLAVLRSAGVVDEDGDWIGGRTHFVQTGDIPDRGPDTRKILLHMMELEKQAKKAGGAVHPLIGNHDAMNVYGDLRYVTEEEFAAFATEDSEALRQRAWREHQRRLRRSDDPPEDWDAYRRKWFDERPLGYFEHRKAFDPSGEFGRWIRKNDAVFKLGDTLFVHGGLSPKYAAMERDEINDTIQDELKDFDKLRGGMATDSEGPLWYRGLAQNPEAEEQANVDAILAAHGVRRIVIGHTPTPGAVWPRFGGKVIQIDVGLSEAYGGRMACLVIEGDELTAIHRGEPLALPETKDTTALLDYLDKAAALDPAPSPLEPLVRQLSAAVGATAGP